MSVIDEVAAERKRQIEVEGWDAEHDADHISGEIALAGAYYAIYHASRLVPAYQEIDGPHVPQTRHMLLGHADAVWPWDTEWRKPKDARRDLIRAAALIVAEIERLDRVKP